MDVYKGYTGRTVSMDHFYMSPYVAKALRQMGVYCRGTVSTNCLELPPCVQYSKAKAQNNERSYESSQ